MHTSPNGGPPDRNGRRLAPPTETVPLKGDGRPRLPANGYGPQTDEEPKRPQWRRPRRDDLQAVVRGVRQTWQSVVRVMALVWATSPQLTGSLAGTTLLQSVMPAAQVWLAGRLIDEVVAGIQAGGSEAHVRAIVILALIQLALLV